MIPRMMEVAIALLLPMIDIEFLIAIISTESVVNPSRNAII
jgi:hypothetical protein